MTRCCVNLNKLAVTLCACAIAVDAQMGVKAGSASGLGLTGEGAEDGSGNDRGGAGGYLMWAMRRAWKGAAFDLLWRG